MQTSSTRSAPRPLPWPWAVWLVVVGLLLASGALFGSCGHDPDAASAQPSPSVHSTRPSITNTSLVHVLRSDVATVATGDPDDATVRVPVAVPR